MKSKVPRIVSLALCIMLILQLLPSLALAATSGKAQKEPKLTITEVPAQALDGNGHIIDTTVKQYTYTFSTVPKNAVEMAQYKLDSPYKTMALLILAYRMWDPDDESTALRMLDYITDTGATVNGEYCPFSEYNPWINALRDRMLQNNKYRFIGNAYLGGAAPENDYTPTEPITVTVRQSVYDPYAKATDWAPEQTQVLISLPGAENDRYCLFAKDESGNWKVFRTSWQNLLADVQTMASDKIYPPETKRPDKYSNVQTEPSEKHVMIPAKASGLDENGEPIVIDTEVEQVTYTFKTVPKSYEDLVQYKLDSPYKTMALFFMALRTWTPEDPDTCIEMLDYLTFSNSDSKTTDAEGHKLAVPFSEYKYWRDFLKDRMMQNTKYRYIGNAYLGGATPKNNYTPSKTITVTLRQSVYDPYKAEAAESPELKQVLIHIEGADNDRYALLYQDQRGDWRFFGDNWMGLLADVQKPDMDVLMPPETIRPEKYTNPQREPVESIFEIPAKAPGVDDAGNPIIIDTTVKQHTFTFTTVPKTYEDIIQYKLDSPYKTMALLILAYRTWTPENPNDCLKMLDYLTNTDVSSGKKDATGHYISRKFSEYQWWYDFLRDRMRQNEKYRYIGNAYLEGAMPSNDYTPSLPVTITVKESVYVPFSSKETKETDPPLYQVLISIPGADNDRYSLFYQDQRGDWRVFGDNWMGLLADVKTPSGDVPLPPEVKRAAKPKNKQKEPVETVRNVAAKAVDENDKPIDVTVEEHTFTFSTIPSCYEDIVQYKLDSPYKTMALYFLALRSWQPENPQPCIEMLDYLTHTAVPDPAATDKDGHPVSYAFSKYNPWIASLRDRMLQNNKYSYIGNAYLGGATPGNNYTPTEPITVTVRQSVYDPYVKASDTSPEVKQVLISMAGDDSDRYSLFYQDQRGDWRFFGDNWKGLLSDIRQPGNAPAITEVTLEASRVNFRVENASEGARPWVAVYDRDGKMLFITSPEGSDGRYSADIPGAGYSCKILLLNDEKSTPLCAAYDVKK
ncbi:MAG: hypothetical protein IIZ19_07830 [Clostridia bacterium]|nr:hypothetical protein [Clostridia bacterium]